MILLQPNWYSGHTRLRTSGSFSCERMKAAERAAITRPRVRGLRIVRVRLSVYWKTKRRRISCSQGRRAIAERRSAGYGRFLRRKEPVACPLEHGQARDIASYLRDELHRARAGTHDGDAPSPRDRSSESHSAEWKLCPAKLSAPSSEGTASWSSWPVAMIRMSASWLSPPSVCTLQLLLVSSQAHEVTVVFAVISASTACSQRHLLQVGEDLQAGWSTGAGPGTGACRTSTSRGGWGRRMPRPDTCCRAMCLPRPGPFSSIRTSVIPCRRSSMAAAIPPNPAPTISALRRLPCDGFMPAVVVDMLLCSLSGASASGSNPNRWGRRLPAVLSPPAGRASRRASR